jgi:hypothetical protein
VLKIRKVQEQNQKSRTKSISKIKILLEQGWKKLEKFKNRWVLCAFFVSLVVKKH